MNEIAANVWHVTPTYGRPHDESEECWCRPTVETVIDEHGVVVGGVVVHNDEN